ncbi:MAG: M20/M25/M40 family metallo-hydrolase [Bacteroidales bacterium]|nr:M20/M25/M40 family metallo-hydrolase [Bacteroidales bacterium]
MKTPYEFALHAYYLLHQIPEASGNEKKTASTLLQLIEELKPDILLSQVGGNGILALWKGNSSLNPIILRCEMDAVYSLEEEKYLHLCGHDGHMATMLGVACYFRSNSTTFKRPWGILFQPSEENGKGAQLIIQSGILEQYKPHCMIGFHNIPEYPLGQIISKPNYFSATVKSFSIQLNCFATHASQSPKQTLLDAIFYLHEGLKGLCYEDNFNFFNYTPICIEMGSLHYGVVPSKAFYHITLRGSSPELLENKLNAFYGLLQSASNSFGFHINYEVVEYFPPISNDLSLYRLLKETAKEMNYQFIESHKPFPWGEDMGYFAQYFPTCFFCLGSGTDKSLHTKEFYYPELLLHKGIIFLVSLIKKMEKEL